MYPQITGGSFLTHGVLIVTEERIKGSDLPLKRIITSIVFFLAISFATFYFLYKFFGEPNRILIFTEFSYSILFLLVVALFLYYFLDGLRLYFILRTLNQKIDFKHLFKLVFINLFISNITPFATGGGFAQIYYLHKNGVSLGSATAATTLRTLLATAFIFILAPLVLITRGNLAALLPGDSILLYSVIFIVVYLLFFYVVIFKNSLPKKYIYKFFYLLNSKEIISRERFRKSILYLFKHIDLFRRKLLEFFRNDIRFVFLSLLSTVLFLLAEFSFSIILIRGMGYEVPIVTILFIQVVIVFVMYFAPTPGASGVAEGGYALLFTRLVAEKDLFPLIFSWRLFTKYIGIFIGMLIFFAITYREFNSRFFQVLKKVLRLKNNRCEGENYH